MADPARIDYRFAVRRGLAATWTTKNEVLYAGEIGLERDTRKFKFGDGQTRWNDLPYVAGTTQDGGGGGSVDLQLANAARVLPGSIALPSMVAAFGEVTIGSRTYLIPLYARDSQSPDPYIGNVVAMLHFREPADTNIDHAYGAWSTSGQITVIPAPGSPSGYGLRLDGSSYLSRAPTLLVGADDFTVEAWINTKINATNYPILASYNAGNNRRAWEFALRGGVPLMILSFNGTSSGSNYFQLGGPSYSPDVWHHVAAVRNAGVVTVYTDGIGGDPASAPAAAYANATDPVFIGTDGSSSSTGTKYVGMLAEVRMTLGIARYVADFTPPAAPFPNY